jgi:transposase
MSRLRQTGSTSDRSHSGRPRETTPRQDCHIRLIHLRDWFVPTTVTARQTQGRRNPRISAQKVCNRLKAAGLRSRRPVVGAVLTQRHRNARLRWATARHYCTRRRWQNVIFSDESRFRLRRSDGRMSVYRRPNERYIDACVHECDRFGGRSVMVWAGITHCGRTDLKIVNGNLNAVRYHDEILSAIVQPFIARHRNCHTFQQDHARCHVACICNLFLAQNNINVLPWPALSPDLSPNEHLWDELDKRVRRRPQQPESVDQLRTALLEGGITFPKHVFNV